MTRAWLPRLIDALSDYEAPRSEAMVAQAKRLSLVSMVSLESAHGAIATSAFRTGYERGFAVGAILALPTGALAALALAGLFVVLR